MKYGIVVPAAGAPGTLATTAFIGSLAEGIETTGASARVIGLTMDAAQWFPEKLRTRETAAPWLAPIAYRLGDRADAIRRGIFDLEGSCHPGGSSRWRLELLLERDLLEFASGDSDLTIVVDSRSVLLLGLSCRVAHRRGWRVVVVSNEALLDHLIDPATRDDYVRCVVGCASGVWAFSEHLSEYWRALGFAAGRIFVSPPPVRASAFASAGKAPGSGRATYIGNLAHREVDHLLEIASLVAAAFPAFKLTIYGDANPDVRHDLATAIAARSLTDSVTVHSPVAPAEIPGVLASADILLLPRSRGEFSAAGFPNKLGEYLASGRPVVATAVGDIPRHLVDGVSAMLVEPDDNNAFATAVVQLLESDALRERIGAGGRGVAQKLMRADALAVRLIQFVESLAPATASSAGTSPARPLWTRPGDLLPDPELTRRDLSLALRRLGYRPR